MKNISLILLLSVLLTGSCMQSQKINTDLIIKNTTIYTVDDEFSKATTMAIKDGEIIAVGGDDILKKYISENVVDAKGNFIYPGFNDGHSHFLGYGINISKYANLIGTNSFEDVISKLEEHDKEFPSNWQLGRGWDQNDWENKDFPDNTILNEKFPDKPVVLTRVDGHAVIANDFALKVIGITKDSKIDGGEVIVKNNRPTGVLIDNAADLMKNAIPEFSRDEKSMALIKAQENCFAMGLTSVTDAGLNKEDILLIKKLQDEGKLKMKIYAMINPNEENFEYFYKLGPQHYNRLTVTSVKLYSDGALGSRGALLLEPYSDDPENYGLQMHPLTYYKKMCQRAYDANFQVNTHAIGDSGNRIMLKTYAEVLKEKNDRRWRVEHAQVVNPSDLMYFKNYSIIPSVQATHCTSDMYWADERLGKERIKTAYAYKDLLKQNGWVVNGTDAPVEGFSPLKTFYAAVVRKDAKLWPDGGFQKENALSPEEALKSITIWPAKGSFDEQTKGSLEVGKKADFVILDRDILNSDEKELMDTKVVATYVNGEKVY